jgi:hypothetical protein
MLSCATPPPWGEFPLRRLPDGWSPRWQAVDRGVAYAAYDGAEAEGTLPPFHLLRIDTRVAEVRLLPPFPRGAEAEELLRSRPGALGVINGSPFRLRSREGRRRMDPVGLWIAGGRRYSQQEKRWGILWQEAAGGRLRVTLAPPETGQARWAAGGFLPIIAEGRNVGIHGERHARTAAGVAGGGRRLIFLIAEGERPGNAGITSREAAQVLLRLGVREALNLDGGRSTTLLLRDHSGERVVEVASGRRELPCFILLYASDRGTGNGSGTNTR